MSFDNPTVFDDLLEGFLCYRILRPRYEEYVKKLELKGSEKVLDFGCGAGASSKPILKKLSDGGHLTCLDISHFWLKKAKKRFSKFNNVDFKIGDITIVDIPGKSYDLISIYYVLHDIDRYQRQKIINLLSSKLKDYGRLAIKEPIKKSHGMPVKEIRDLMNNSGLKEICFKMNKSHYFGIFKIGKENNKSLDR